MTVANLKSAIPAFVCGLLLAGTLAGGLVQRQIGAGAASPERLRAAAAVLERPLPSHFGHWRLLQEAELEADVVKMLRCPAYVNRIYVHEQTGDRVSVAVLLGPAGPIAVHTPEICYSSQDYKLTNERSVAKLTDRTGAEHTFWDVSFQSSDFSQSKLRVLYAWSTGSRWESTQDPRFAFAARPYLYKIQVAGPPSDDSAQFDPCQDFLTQFITLVRPQLLPADPA